MDNLQKRGRESRYNSLSKTEIVFFDLLRVGLWNWKPDEGLFPLTEQEWQDVFILSKRQALLGVVFDGVAKLSLANQPSKMQKLQWIAIVQKIELQNIILNRKAVEISENFRKNGFDNVILKGQGIGINYLNPLHRQSGDIDIYLRAKRRDILSYFSSFSSSKPSVSYHHIQFAIPGADVECHTHCALFYDPLFNWKLQKKLNYWTGKSFNNFISLPEGKIPIPIVEMNQVYLLVHLFRHLFCEGIGLRQVCDYALFMDRNFHEVDIQVFLKDLRDLGLLSFAQAVFSIMVKYLGYPKEKLPMNLEESVFAPVLFNEIMLAGNFGKFDPRIKRIANESYWSKFVRLSSRSMAFVYYYPREVVCRPFYKIYHFFWRKFHGYI